MDGWLTEPSGASWHIVPAVISELLQNTDAEKSKRVIESVLQMKTTKIFTSMGASRAM